LKCTIKFKLSLKKYEREQQNEFKYKNFFQAFRRNCLQRFFSKHIVIVNVFLRYLFNYSIYWAEEVATICFVWCVFVGASATYKHKMDMGIDVLIKKTPEKIEKAIRLKIEKAIRFAVTLILLALNGYIFYMAIVFTKIAWAKPTAVLGISSAALNSALIVGFGLITLHTIKFLYRDTMHYLRKGDA